MELCETEPGLATRSNVGVGITPPKVLGAANPTSSVMINRTLGAPFGGTIVGGHHAFDWQAFASMTPPNFAFWGGELVAADRGRGGGVPGVP